VDLDREDDYFHVEEEVELTFSTAKSIGGGPVRR
jgi:hypothetical protein